MLLSQTAGYALQVMAHLALHPVGAPVPGREIGKLTTVPASYLSKVCRHLVVAGLLRSRKGHGGGFTLAREAGAITLAEILEAVDGTPGLDQCIAGFKGCDSSEPCLLHDPWAEVVESFRAWAASTTLDQLPVSGPRQPPDVGTA